jgi:hydrogenase maturation protease
MTARVMVAGIGSELRRDDGVGPAVVERVRRLGVGPEWVVWSGTAAVDLLGLWGGCELAVVVDATHNGVEPGTVRVFDLQTDADGPRRTGMTGTTSTHGLGLATVLSLGRALGRLPRRLVLVGIEGRDFGAGDVMSPAVAAAVDEAAARVYELSKYEPSKATTRSEGGEPCA